MLDNAAGIVRAGVTSWGKLRRYFTLQTPGAFGNGTNRERTPLARI